MPVIITENLSIQHKIVNGTQGIIRDIVYRVILEGREATVFVNMLKLAPPLFN